MKRILPLLRHGILDKALSSSDNVLVFQSPYPPSFLLPCLAANRTTKTMQPTTTKGRQERCGGESSDVEGDAM